MADTTFTIAVCVALCVVVVVAQGSGEADGVENPANLQNGTGQRFCNYSRTLEFHLPISCSANATAGDHLCAPGERFVVIKAYFTDGYNDTDDADDIDDGSGTVAPDDYSWTNDADNFTWTTTSSDDGYETTAATYDRNCQLTCAKDFRNMAACCPGYFGYDCRECPRGKDGSVCSGRGHCRDGIYNDGVCQCMEPYSGLVCELCKYDTMYGPGCEEECQCVNGVCDNGPSGNGTCRQCFLGYHGPLCTEEIITCDTLICGNNSECEETANSTVQCVCVPGYERIAENDTDCQLINRCNHSPSLCGENAVCIPTGPGTYECQCQANHHGDGYMCRPINPCETNNGGCDTQTTVCINTAPNASLCDCMAGYEGYAKGSGCSLIDVCVQGSCHTKATCTTIAPYEFKCTCNPGYMGDGVNCYGNIIEQLEVLNRVHPSQQGQLSMAIDLLKTVYLKPLQEHGPFTFFVPSNRGFRKASRRDFSYRDMLREVERSQQVIRQHILIGNLTLEDLQEFDHYYTLQGNIADLQVRAARDVFKYKVRGHESKAKVIARDLPASNGMIHIVNELLTNDPDIIGDASESAMELIKKEGRFNRMQTLIRSLGMESEFERDNITVFAPENGGLDGLPVGTLDYLLKEEDGKIKLRTLLQNHIFSGRIVVTDLVNLKRIHSLANYAFSVSVTKMGQIRLNGKVNISQANIPCSNAACYHIDAPLIPPELADILPRHCDILQNITVKGRCDSCTSEMRCPLDTDIKTNEIIEKCYLWAHPRFGRLGCQPICLRPVSIAKCCDGFYGQDCQPCPGGHRNPCSGHGKCNDQMFGSGICICDKNFRGLKCELCLDAYKYGPDCTDDCTCKHGECDGGPEGSGKCVPGSCHAGYTGDNCELEKKRCYGRQLICHHNAECVLDLTGRPRCQCKAGYEGDSQLCEEINPCEKPGRGGCHLQAKCSKIGPGAHKCECDSGWFGDGFTCHPVTPCTSNQDCHSNGSCHNLGPGEYSCMCTKGYNGNGTYCEEVDGCLTNNGECDPLANCTSTGPGTVNCTCPDYYVGNGQQCFTTLAGHIRSHDNLTLLADLLKKLDPDNVMLADVGESVTFLAPSDAAMETFMREKVPKGYFDDPEDLLTFFNFHTLTKDYELKEMLALEAIGNFGRFETFFDGYSIRVFIKNKTVNVLSSQTTSVQVLQSDIVGLNGYLHVINGVLEPFLPDADQPFLREFFEMNPDYSAFGKWLERKGLISQLQAMDRYTLFVPDNSAFSDEAARQTITEDYLKYYIVSQIILTPALDDNQTVDSLLGPTHQLLFTVEGDEVFVDGARIVRANVMMMEGVVHVIDAPLTPVLNFCNKKTFRTEFGLCGSCGNTSNLKCAEGMKPADSPFIQKFRCTYNISDVAGLMHSYLGCRRLCAQNIMIVQCCAGHFGSECEECPGGPETPCGGEERGVCEEGYKGTGHCSCNTLYTGIQCENCKDANMAGPYCNISKMSCDYQNGNCSENAECIESETQSGVHCRCRYGYIGDGYQCTFLCDTTSACHPNATCSLKPNATLPDTTCTCKPGFHGNGQWCKANVDRCEAGGGGCSMYADCRFSPPPVTSEDEGDVTCQCLPGYTGNGTLCVTTALNALSQIPAASAFYQAVMEWRTPHNITQLLDNHQAAVTVFVPVGNASVVSFSGVLRYDDYVVPQGLVTDQNLVRENNGTGIVSSSGLTLSLTQTDQQYFIEGVKILERNIPSLNGYINLIETPFGQSLVPRPSTSSDLEAVVIIIPIAVMLLLVLVIVGGVCCYRRSQAAGFLDIVKRFRQGSDASMSFARLQAQEEPDDIRNPFSQPDNVNFDNPLYNDPETL